MQNHFKGFTIFIGRGARHSKACCLGESLAGLRAADITTDKISAYQAAQKRAGYANATIDREIAALKRPFRLAHRAGRITTVPHLDMLQEDNVPKGFFEPDQLKTLLKHLPEYLHPVFPVADMTGWRVKFETKTRPLFVD
jgi:hypothetical protein